MALPGITLPTITMCLKRCRSEDSNSLITELCSPPPNKQACLASPALCTSQSTHHLSLLQDLESSLDASAVESPTPEELVMEMMQSLERVMQDIGELVSVSSKATKCVESLVNSPHRHALSRDRASDDGKCKLAQASGEGTLCVGTTDNIYDAQQRIDSIGDVTLGCGECEVVLELDSYARDGLNAGSGAVSGLPAYAGDGSDAGEAVSGLHAYAGHGSDAGEESTLCDWLGERYVEGGSLEGICNGGHVGLDNMQHLLDMSDDELGISQAGVGHTSSSELKDEQWTLLDDFAAAVACNDGGNSCGVFLEEGYDVSSCSLPQYEEGTLAMGREQSTLDCCF